MLMPAGVRYEFVTDVDSVLHKTAHFNSMLASVESTRALSSVAKLCSSSRGQDAKRARRQMPAKPSDT